TQLAHRLGRLSHFRGPAYPMRGDALQLIVAEARPAEAWEGLCQRTVYPFVAACRTRGEQCLDSNRLHPLHEQAAHHLDGRCRTHLLPDMIEVEAHGRKPLLMHLVHTAGDQNRGSVAAWMDRSHDCHVDIAHAPSLYRFRSLELAA